MLKRAGISLEIAVVAGLLGFSGLLQTTAPFAQFVCFAFAAISGLSLLFCLFEDCGPSRKPEDVQATPISLQNKEALAGQPRH